MTSRKTFRLLGFGLLGGAGLFLIHGTIARAANPTMNITGSICRPTSSTQENDFSYDSRIANTSTGARNVICPVPADIDLGAHIEWSFTFEDRSATAATSCQGFTVSPTDDSVVWMSQSKTSGANSFVGVVNVASDQGPNLGPNVKWRHFANCTLPAISSLPSAILAVRMF